MSNTYTYTVRPYSKQAGKQLIYFTAAAAARWQCFASKLERLEVGTVHRCLTCVSGYMPIIKPPPSLGNLLLDITLC